MINEQRSFTDVQREAEKAAEEAKFKINGNRVQIPWGDPEDNEYIEVRNHDGFVEVYVNTGRCFPAVVHTSSNIFEIRPMVNLYLKGETLHLLETPEQAQKKLETVFNARFGKE